MKSPSFWPVMDSMTRPAHSRAPYLTGVPSSLECTPEKSRIITHSIFPLLSRLRIQRSATVKFLPYPSAFPRQRHSSTIRRGYTHNCSLHIRLHARRDKLHNLWGKICRRECNTRRKGHEHPKGYRSFARHEIEFSRFGRSLTATNIQRRLIS